jgi:hypothetical protein
MITKAQAVERNGSGHFAKHSEFYHGSRRDSAGFPVKARRNGQTKTWVTRPDEFHIPTIEGFRGYSYIDQDDADQWFLTQDEAMSDDEKAFFAAKQAKSEARRAKREAKLAGK